MVCRLVRTEAHRLVVVEPYCDGTIVIIANQLPVLDGEDDVFPMLWVFADHDYCVLLTLVREIKVEGVG